MACQNVVGHKGVYGRLVRREDRAPLVYWLKEATSSQHLTLWEVMDAILIASADESSFIPRMIRPPTVADDWGVDIDLEEVLEGIKGALPKLAAAAKQGGVGVGGGGGRGGGGGGGETVDVEAGESRPAGSLGKNADDL